MLNGVDHANMYKENHVNWRDDCIKASYKKKKILGLTDLYLMTTNIFVSIFLGKKCPYLHIVKMTFNWRGLCTETVFRPNWKLNEMIQSNKKIVNDDSLSNTIP